MSVLKCMVITMRAQLLSRSRFVLTAARVSQLMLEKEQASLSSRKNS